MPARRAIRTVNGALRGIVGRSSLAAIAVACTVPATLRAQGSTLPRVAISGNDYAFASVPDTVAAGPTLLAFSNAGRVRHELSVALLREGVTPAQVMQRAAAGLSPVGSREIMDQPIGVLVARPGESSGGQLYVDLKPGRTYMIVCTLKDTPDARPHAELGMMASFVVR
jgi:hypothetical protein